MKKVVILLFAVVLASSCGVSRRVSRNENLSWIGYPALEILQVMGNPDRIDSDGKGGSILRYEVKSDYEDPSYDMLDPEAKPGEGGHADFYLDREGDCYRVDADCRLPAPDDGLVPAADDEDDRIGIWLDILIYLPLLLVGILL